jgi:hypothetical protein
MAFFFSFFTFSHLRSHSYITNYKQLFMEIWSGMHSTLPN